MAQPNVVREPSMDEILASIRRIIESNDPVPPGVATGMAEPEGFSGSAANDDMEEVPLTIDDVFASRQEPARQPMEEAFFAERAEAPRAAAPREQDVAAQPQRSLSLADVAARVRAASERNPGLRELAPQPAEEDVAPPTSPLMTSRMAAAGGSLQAERPQVDWNELSAHSEAPREELTRMEESHHVEDMPVMAKVEPETVISKSAASESAAPTSLISVDAGQQVARSFQDLAVAIDEAERRSYEDIAADLLRPMLQEWLDENLPTLVERLVREEIERVARGNRR
jgi:cell pole-organizing protein PopZ